MSFDQSIYCAGVKFRQARSDSAHRVLVRFKESGRRAIIFVSRLVLLSVFLITTALAQEHHPTYEIRVPRLVANEALHLLAQQTGIPMLYPHEAVRDIVTNPVNGRYSLSDALDILFKDTGLEGVVNQSGVLTITINGQLSAGEEGRFPGKKRRSILERLAGAFFGGLFEDAASAEDSQNTDEAGTGLLEELIVTAQKREQNLQDVPISVAVVSGDGIMTGAVSRLEDMAATLPGLMITETRASAILAMRGISTSDGNISFEQSVSTFIDGIYRNRTRSSGIAFLDVDRVEVLRGPQTTYFGQNTIAGGISIVSKKPTKEWEGYLNASHEFEFGDTSFDLAYGGPLTDTLGIRVAARKSDLDGWGENTVTGKDINGRESFAYRISAGWETTDNLAVELKYDHSNLEQGEYGNELINCQPVNTRFRQPSPCGLAIANGLPGQEFEFNQKISAGGAYALPTQIVFGAPTGDGSTRPDLWGEEYRTADEAGGSLTVNYSLPNDIILTSLIGYNESRFDKLVDLDRTAYAVVNVSPDEKYRQKSVEFRITSPVDQAIDWMTGAYYQEGEVFETVTVNTVVNEASQLNSYFSEDAEWLSFFGGVTFNITDNFSLDLGLRYSEVEKKSQKQAYNTVSINPDPTAPPPRLELSDNSCLGNSGVVNPSCSAAVFEDSSIDYNVGVNYNIPGTDVMVYGKFTTGFKAGGSSASNDSFSEEEFTFDSENAESIEIGIKSTLFDGRLEFNAALFKTVITEGQVSTFDAVASQRANRAVSVINNAAKQTSQGLEVDGRFAASENLILSYSATFLDAEYDSYPDAQCNPQEVAAGICDVNGFIDRAGQELVYAAEFEGRVKAIYSMSLIENLDLDLSAIFYYNSGYENSTIFDKRHEQGGYERVDLRATLVSVDGKWSASIFGNNVTDEVVVTRLGQGDFNGIGSFELDSSRGAGYGVQFRYNF